MSNLKFLSTHDTQEIVNPIKVIIYRDLIIIKIKIDFKQARILF